MISVSAWHEELFLRTTNAARPQDDLWASQRPCTLASDFSAHVPLIGSETSRRSLENIARLHQAGELQHCGFSATKDNPSSRSRRTQLRIARTLGKQSALQQRWSRADDVARGLRRAWRIAEIPRSEIARHCYSPRL